MLKPVRTIGPTELPVSLEVAKRHLNIVHDDDDSLIDLYIDAAASYLDGRSGIVGRALLSQTWRQDFDGFGCELRLSPSPVVSVSSVTYYDGRNVSQTLATSIYRMLEDERGAYVTTKPLQYWPASYGREDAVSVTYVSGYGTKSSDVPAPLRHAMLLLIGHWMESREAVIVGNVTATDVPFAVNALIAPYRVVGF